MPASDIPIPQDPAEAGTVPRAPALAGVDRTDLPARVHSAAADGDLG
ncbi:hypothetical protein AB0G15_16725 [Streptosporangium sp. NPDC023825]